MRNIINLKRHLLGREKIPFYLLASIIGAITAIGLSATLICIYFGKPIGDDFGAISFHHNIYWFDSAIKSLQSTGRYGQSVAGSLSYGLLGKSVAVILPLGVVIWSTILVYLIINRADARFKMLLSPPIKMALSGVLMFALLIVNTGVDGTPPQTWITFQTFFWSSGIITYTVPLLLLISTVYLLLVRRALINRSSLLVYIIIVYILGLFNEVQPATLFVLSAGTFLLTYVPVKTSLIKRARNWRNVYITTAVASFMSLLTLLLSSGNKERRSATGALNYDGLLNGIISKVSYVFDHMFYRPHDLFLIIAIGFVVAYGFSLFRKEVKVKTANTGILLGVFILLCSIVSIYISVTLLILGYGVGTGILPRTLLIPQILFCVGLILIFTCGSISIIQLLPKQYTSYVISLISIIITIILCSFGTRYMDKITTQLSSVIEYSHAWDYQDAILKEHARNNPDQPIFIPGDYAGIGDGFSIHCVGPYVQNTMWLNEAIEKYYGVKKICAIEDTQIAPR